MILIILFNVANRENNCSVYHSKSIIFALLIIWFSLIYYKEPDMRVMVLPLVTFTSTCSNIIKPYREALRLLSGLLSLTVVVDP